MRCNFCPRFNCFQTRNAVRICRVQPIRVAAPQLRLITPRRNIRFPCGRGGGGPLAVISDPNPLFLATLFLYFVFFSQILVIKFVYREGALSATASVINSVCRDHMIVHFFMNAVDEDGYASLSEHHAVFI